jgi:glycosyltransferase involved in cell wall biosynthesis
LAGAKARGLLMAGRVSVVVPAYNAGAFLAAALDSVFAQDCPAHEVIVVNDGSTDNTAEVIAGYVGKVRVVSQANLGIAGARNAGLAGLTGDLVAFLDADDLWPANSLSARAAVLAAHPDIGFVFGGVEQFLSPELLTGGGPQPACPPGIRPAPCAGACLIRRDLFRSVGLFRDDLAIGETIDWIGRARDAGIEERQIDTLVMRRRIHADNTTRRHAVRRNDYLHVLKARLNRRRQAIAV